MGALPIHLFRHCFCIIQPQGTASQTVTDGQTGEITKSIANHTACSKIGLKTKYQNQL